MAKKPDDLVLPILRDIQATPATHGRDSADIKDLADIKGERRRQGGRVDELFESSTMALGLAGRANLRHDSIQRQPGGGRGRLDRLEWQH